MIEDARRDLEADRVANMEERAKHLARLGRCERHVSALRSEISRRESARGIPRMSGVVRSIGRQRGPGLLDVPAGAASRARVVLARAVMTLAVEAIHPKVNR